MSDEITVGSLFSGIGGLDLGLERAGMRVVWQVEKDDYCRRVLEKHWPDVKRYEDVRDVGQHNLERADLICGGFPCQPVSCAGQRKGTSDNRWLWPEFARVVCETRPRWVLGENVPGLLSIDDGRVFGGILRDLAACGYAVEWDCIPAAAVGAPHIRDRVFLVGHTDDQGESALSINAKVAWVPSSLADSICSRLERRTVFGGNTGTELSAFKRSHREPGGQWRPEPDVGRVAHGVPARVDRLRGLGNAVVPQVAEWIGRRIIEAPKS